MTTAFARSQSVRLESKPDATIYSHLSVRLELHRHYDKLAAGAQSICDEKGGVKSRAAARHSPVPYTVNVIVIFVVLQVVGINSQFWRRLD